MPASDDWIPPDENGLVVDDVYLHSREESTIHAWWCRCDTLLDSVMLFCHGNAGNLSHRGRLIKNWQTYFPIPVMIFDYPGYGKSSGKPNESGCYAAADAVYDWLVNEKAIAPERIILTGESLGGGVAVDLAVRRPHRAVVLISTFTSIPDVARRFYPWLPVRRMMFNRFDNLAKIGKCSRPVFLVHGLIDSLVPVRHSEMLYAAIQAPKHLLTLPDHEHSGLLPAEFYTGVRQFIETTTGK